MLENRGKIDKNKMRRKIENKKESRETIMEDSLY